MLVHLVISGKDSVADFDLFISAEPMPKQTQVPTWKVTAMIYPPVQKPESAVHIKSIDVVATNRLADFAL